MPSRRKKHRKATKKGAEPQGTDSGDVKHDTTSCEQRGMKEWAELGTPPPVVRALADLGFSHPTPIQQEAIPPAIHDGADVIGAAETGSGKTLAFAIPILHYILKLHPQAQSPLTPAGAKSDTPADKQLKSKLRKSDLEPRQKRRSKKPTGASWRSVIPLNEVLHSTREELSEPSGESDGELDQSDDKKRSHDDSDSDGETNGSVRDEEQLAFIAGSSSKGSDTVDSEGGQLSSEGGVSSDDEVEEVPKKKRKRMFVRRVIMERRRDRRRRGCVGVGVSVGAVRVCDDIPDEEFQLMLEGKLDGWSSTEQSTDHLPTVEKLQPKVKSGCGLIALIVTPTRELALQVQSHIKAVANYTGVRVCVVVGGMATEKQERLLKLHPHIVVATPGRLWKLISEGEPHLCNYDDLQFLVLDEADRMVEFGHYRELGYILDRLNGGRVKGHKRQTLVFSATLTISRRTTERKRKKRMTSTQETIENLMVRVGLRDDARIVDLTRSKVTVQTLTETKIMCTTEEKDLHLYYFLLVHPGRSIVFVNSIDCLQRVRAVLELLGQKPHPLHAHMQQRQRLKNLDRFSTNPAGLLVASDVAARGLDLPSVDHIVHYQVPRNSELYVHRSGRTARGRKEGLSVMLVCPEDLKAYQNICRTLNRDDIPNFPVDYPHLMSLRGRVSLARQVYTIECRRDNTRRSERWTRQTADALGVELEEDQLGRESGWTKREEQQVQRLRGELKDLLQTVVLPRGLSHKFPTRDQDHTLLSQLQGQRSGLSQSIVLEKEKALLLAKKHRQATE